MDIILDNLLPDPLKEQQATSGLWGKNLIFAKGTIVHIQAPSAQGKTTFISMLYGLRHDFTGTLHFNTTPSTSLSPHEWAQLRRESLSIVFQDLRLFDRITGLENILVKARLTNTTDKKKIMDMADRCGIVGILDKKVAYCSRGEKQRIAIIRALVQPFTWLLMDEPFSHLDADNRKKVIGCILARREEEQAGLILTSLGKNSFFSYDQKVSV